METQKRLSLFIGSLLATIFLLRIYLLFSPSTNINFGKYNIHHLFIGAFFIIVLLLFFIFNIINKFTIIAAGISSASVLDEIIYLIATDGSDTAYLSAISLWGAVILTAVILILAIVLNNLKKHQIKE